MKILALIPARGGSKGLPGKNIKDFAGKPLIARTIDMAMESQVFDRIIVSTDDNEIASVSKRYGAEIPFIRPSEIACDDTPVIKVMLHALETLEKTENYHVAHMMLLQPTSPLRNSQDIVNAVELFKEKKADAIISVYETHHHPFFSKTLGNNGNLIDLMGKSENIPRQKYPKALILNGAIYLFKTNLIKSIGSFYTEKTFPYIMPHERSLDIDTELEFQMAEWIFNRAKKE